MSKPIGDLTLKAAPAGADMIAIADSQDSNKTKKILVSAISGGGGGGSDMIHVLDDTVTWSDPTYSATGTGITQYEDGHFYLIKFPTISGTISDARNVNINNIGNVPLEYNDQSDWYNGFTSKANVLPKTQHTSILLYRSATNRFYLIDSDYSTYKNQMLCRSFVASSKMSLGPYCTSVEQIMYNEPSTTPSITISGSAGYHRGAICLNPITALTINANNSSSWETEIHFTTDSTFSLTISGTKLKWLGDAAPTFDPNTSYVIAIKNGYGVCSKVVP